MNEMNPWEQQMRSWRPRQPSTALKRRLIAAETHAHHTARWLWGCLTPAAACGLLTLMAFNHDESLGRRPVQTMIWSNQTYAALTPAEGQTTQNHLDTVTFDWTNHGGFNSSMGFTRSTNFSNQ